MKRRTNTEEREDEWDDTIRLARIEALDEVLEAARQAGATFTPDSTETILKAVASVCDVEQFDRTRRLRKEIRQVLGDIANEQTSPDIAILKISFKTELLPDEQERYLSDFERQRIRRYHRCEMSIREIAYVLDRSISTVHQVITEKSTERTQQQSEYESYNTYTEV